MRTADALLPGVLGSLTAAEVASTGFVLEHFLGHFGCHDQAVPQTGACTRGLLLPPKGLTEPRRFAR